MDPHKKRTIEYTSFVIGVVIIISSYVIALETQGSAAPITTSLLILGIFTSFITYALLEYYDYTLVKKAEETFPRFLRDYAEAINSGMNFSQAFDLVLKNDYGALNEYLKRAKNRMSLNIPFPRVIRLLQNELKKSNMIKNALSIMINSYYSGGDVAMTMMDLSETVLNLREIYEEKKSILHQQVLIMYAIFFIFIGIILVLYYVFKPIASMEGGEVGIKGMTLNLQLTNYCDKTLYPQIYPICTFGYIFGYNLNDNLTYFKILLFFTAIIQAISIGLMIGVVYDNEIKAGFKHAAILLTVTFLIFALLL